MSSEVDDEEAVKEAFRSGSVMQKGAASSIPQGFKIFQNQTKTWFYWRTRAPRNSSDSNLLASLG